MGRRSHCMSRYLVSGAGRRCACVEGQRLQSCACCKCSAKTNVYLKLAMILSSTYVRRLSIAGIRPRRAEWESCWSVIWKDDNRAPSCLTQFLTNIQPSVLWAVLWLRGNFVVRGRRTAEILPAAISDDDVSSNPSTRRGVPGSAYHVESSTLPSRVVICFQVSAAMHECCRRHGTANDVILASDE